MSGDDPRAAAIAEAIDAISKSWAIPAAVVAIADRDGLVFEYAYGHSDLERGITATPDDLFEIGSISKILTSTVVLRLIDERKLAFDDPASKHLEGLPETLASADVTVERMLNHSAGLVSGIDAVPDQEAQVYGFSGLRSDAVSGDLFHYSNLGFIVLGLIVERVTGRVLSELVQEWILDPAGAVDSRPVVTFDDYERLARGYQPRNEDRPWLPGDPLAVAPYLEVDGADGCVAMTARDLAVFGRILLAGGTSDRREVLSPAGFEAMTTRVATGGEDLLNLRGIPASDQTRYGLGINVERRGDALLLSHGGGMIGYATFFLVDPTAGISVAALTSANGDGPISESLARVAAAIWDGTANGTPGNLDPAVWSTLDADADRPTGATRPRLLDPAMVGTFTSSAGELVVSSTADENSTARLTVTFGGDSSPLGWDWGPRALTRLSGLAPYPLQFDGENWTWGAEVFRPASVEAPPPPSDPELDQYLGRFRTYNPWFTNFRIVRRDGGLILIATPGVEAPGADVPLVQIAERTFRMGDDPRVPDALVFGPAIGGLAQWVDRNGCRYSRSFLP